MTPKEGCTVGLAQILSGQVELNMTLCCAWRVNSPVRAPHAKAGTTPMTNNQAGRPTVAAAMEPPPLGLVPTVATATIYPKKSNNRQHNLPATASAIWSD